MEHISNQLQKVVNQVPAKQESQLPKTIDSSFVAALQGRPIKDCSLEELKDVLKRIFVKVGLREANFPYAEEKDLLHDHILANYGGHTRNEIILAFEMGMAGKLENPKGDVLDMTTYENFSCLYFSQVMNAYREWAKQAYRQNIKEVPKIDAPKEEMTELTYQDWYDSIKKDYQNGTQKSIEFLPPLIADWLIKKGEIDHEQYFKRAAIMIGKKLAAESEESKEKYQDYVEFKRQYEKAINQGEPFTGKWPAMIERLAKQIALNNYILQEIEL